MDDYLAISALQHYAFCPRQFALIHVEQVWNENRYTAEGRLLHERVDAGVPEQRRNVRFERAVSLLSERHGLIGKMDLLEIEVGGDLPRYIPVEYKRGKPKIEDWDRIQLCAQALCIEEMRNTSVQEGAIWYWQVRRRESVQIDELLRANTVRVIREAKEIFDAGRTPPPVNDRRCRACSLVDLCNPRMFYKDFSGAYVRQMYADAESVGGDDRE